MREHRGLPADFVARLRAKDPSLWSDDPTERAEIAQRLGWIDAPERMLERLPEIEALVAGVRADGFDRALVLGMGGSSLAAEVFGEVYRGTPGGLEVRVCDSTVPAAVRAATQWADLGHTLFIVSSKSGTTAEVDALYRHFRSRHHDEPHRFVAITDPGTPLERLAAEQRFRACVLGFPDVGGRYSALTPFGLVPAALAGALISALRFLAVAAGLAAETAEAVRSCTDSIDEVARTIWGPHDSPMHTATRHHLLWQERYQWTPAMCPWTEQLFAESSGKQGRGVLPVVGAASAPSAPRPHLSSPAAAMMQQMIDCAALCAMLGVNPFDQPDVDAAKRRTLEQLARVEAGQSLDAPPAADHRAVRALLDGRRETDEYVALLAFVHRTDATDAVLNSIALLLQARGLATSIGYGPRYLHSTGRFHKGGPDCGLFIVITADDAELPIPGKPYDFQSLCLAQAYGDIAALRDRGRRVVHWTCGPDVAAGLAQLRDAIAPPLV